MNENLNSQHAITEALLRLRFADNANHEQADIALIDHSLQADRLYHEQLRMLPMLYHKLDKLMFSNASTVKIKSIYRHTHYRNRLLIDRALKAQRFLNKEFGLSTLVLKGIGLSVGSYAHIGERAMSDIDLWAPHYPLYHDEITPFLKEKQSLVSQSQFPVCYHLI